MSSGKSSFGKLQDVNHASSLIVVLLLQKDDPASTYGVQFATGVWSLTVEGVEGMLSLTSGEKLALPKDDSNAAHSEAEGLSVVVKDWLGQVIRGDTADASELLPTCRILATRRFFQDLLSFCNRRSSQDSAIITPATAL